MAQSPIIDPNTGQPMNVAGSKQILGDDQLRAKQAAEEIRVILEAYDAELFPVMMLSPRGVVGVTVDVLPKQRPTAPMERVPAEDKEASTLDGLKDAAPSDEGQVPEEAEKAAPEANGEAVEAEKEVGAEVVDLADAKKEADTVGDDGEVA